MPQAPLALGDDGKFYGPCFNFGPNSKYGTLFKITPAEIISRNLTPHCTGRPAGGRTCAAIRADHAVGNRFRSLAPDMLRRGEYGLRSVLGSVKLMLPA
jgi:hypothetical protein